MRREQFYATLSEDEKSEFACWIIDPDGERVEQCLLESDAYQLAFKADNGVVASRAVAGFAAPVRAVFDARENLVMLANMQMKWAEMFWLRVEKVVECIDS